MLEARTILDQQAAPARRAGRRPERVVFHYSSLFSVVHDLKNGFIETCTECASDDDGFPVVLPEAASVAWCTTDPQPDPAANVAYLLGLIKPEDRQRLSRPGGITDLARIVCRATAAPHHLRAHWRRIGVPRSLINSFVIADVCDNGSDPTRWRVSPVPIAASDWISVDVWHPWRRTWIPIHESEDRMIGEILRFLPSHLRGNSQRNRRRLSPAVSRSPWVLQNADRPLENGKVDISDVDDAWFEELHAPTFEERNREMARVRQSWLSADALSALGVAVFPCDSYLPEELKQCSMSASSSRDFVDKTWLETRPGAGLGVVFGTRSGNAFGVLIEGERLLQRFAASRAFPPTLAASPFPGCADTLLLLYSAPVGMRVPTGLLERTADGVIVVLGEERRQMLRMWPKEVGHRPDDLPPRIVSAPEWLLRRVQHLPQSCSEFDLGCSGQPERYG
jgi:hypothetical protein